MKKKVVIIGGLNMDICGDPEKGSIFRMRDSNRGTVSFTAGGVGRNIAHNLVYLGFDAKLLSVVGNDVFGSELLRQCIEAGIDVSGVRVIEGARSSIYLYVNDAGSDMCVGINDMGIVENIGKEYIKPFLPEINSADAVCLDADPPRDFLKWIGENVNVPVFADAVSAVKVHNLADTLPYLTGFKPNAMEALELTGEKTVEAAAEAIVNAGCKNVFITMGAGGIYCANAKERIKINPVKTVAVNTTGAGDSCSAAIIWALLNGRSLRETGMAAAMAGSITIASEKPSTEKISEITGMF